MERYNFSAKQKLTDIFPKSQHSIDSSVSAQKNINISRKGIDMVNVSYIDKSTITAKGDDTLGTRRNLPQHENGKD